MADWEKAASKFISDTDKATDIEAEETIDLLTFSTKVLHLIYDEMGEMPGEDDSAITSDVEAAIIMKAIAARARMDSEWMA